MSVESLTVKFKIACEVSIDKSFCLSSMLAKRSKDILKNRIIAYNVSLEVFISNMAFLPMKEILLNSFYISKVFYLLSKYSL
jgi:hypothetical protein